MENTKKQILVKGIVEDIKVYRWAVPFSARESQKYLSPGDKLKIYDVYTHKLLSERLGREIIVVTFKKNNNNTMNTWCFSNDEFMSFVNLTPTKHLDKILKEISE